jgi:hypothetical protein
MNASRHVCVHALLPPREAHATGNSESGKATFGSYPSCADGTGRKTLPGKVSRNSSPASDHRSAPARCVQTMRAGMICRKSPPAMMPTVAPGILRKQVGL